MQRSWQEVEKEKEEVGRGETRTDLSLVETASE
jgi:hypothetical protein